MDFAEWYEMGIAHEFIADAICATHDGSPVTEVEYETEVCVFACRILTK